MKLLKSIPGNSIKRLRLRIGGRGGGGDLWEVDEGDVLLVVDHEVELVEIAVNHSVLRQSHQKIH